MASAIKAAAIVLYSCLFLGVSGGIIDRRRSIPVSLTVFYEVTQESYEFFTNELVPTYLFVNQNSPVGQPLKLAVGLKPFTTRSSYQCQGDDRILCANAKLQACASALTSPPTFPNEWSRLDYVACSISPSYNLYQQQEQFKKNEKCVATTCVDSTMLAWCANSADGDALLKANREDFERLQTNATGKPVLVFGPRMVVKLEDQDKGLENLMALLCQKFQGSFQGCDSARVLTKKQFSFTDDLTIPLKGRCTQM